MPNPEITHSLTKLSHLKDPEIAKDQYQHGPIPEDKTFLGAFLDAPTVGRSFAFWIPKLRDFLILSTVKATFKPSQISSGADKLVLPSGFPEPERLEIPELLESDTLIATRNSLYLLREHSL